MTATEQALEIARVAARAAVAKLASDPVAFDVSERLAITDIFLIVTATNERQVGAVVDGIEEALLTTLHSVMNDQPLIDGYHHDDLRRTRSAMQSIIPVSTGLARGVERLLPALAGRVQAKAIRVPTHNVSAIDMVLSFGREVSAEAVNRLLRENAAGPQRGLLACSDEAHASIDFNHDPRSSIYDSTQTRVMDGTLVKVLSWYDNEWGFSNRMADTAVALAKLI